MIWNDIDTDDLSAKLMVLYQINGICPIFRTVGVVSNRTIGVNLRKELVCSRAIHCASYIQRKEAQ